MGRTLAAAFQSAGLDVRLFASRGRLVGLAGALKSTPGAIVFLTVPEAALGAVAAAVAGGSGSASAAFVHVSGASRLGEIGNLGGRYAVGSFHPLQSFPNPRNPEALKGIAVAVDASTPGLLKRLERLARAIGATPRRVTDDARAPYHAAAVMASNYLDALLGEAVQVLGAIGWSEGDAIAGLVPLAEGALANLRKRGVAAALTGPIRRGDTSTVRLHIAALAELDRSAGRRAQVRKEDIYRMLGLITLGIAEAAGLEPAAARRMQRALTQKAAATQRRRRA